MGKKNIDRKFFGPNSILYDLSVLSCSSLLTADLNNNNTEFVWWVGWVGGVLDYRPETLSLQLDWSWVELRCDKNLKVREGRGDPSCILKNQLYFKLRKSNEWIYWKEKVLNYIGTYGCHGLPGPKGNKFNSFFLLSKCSKGGWKLLQNFLYIIWKYNYILKVCLFIKTCHVLSRLHW